MLLESVRTVAGALRALVAVLLILTGVPPGLAQAASARVTVLTAGGAADDEFVRQLRTLEEPGGDFRVIRLDGAGTTAPAVVLAPDNEAGQEAANAGVRTRGRIAPATAPAGAAMTVAVGAEAARSAVERDGADPLLLAMLSQLEYEQLKSSPGLHRTGRRVAVLLRDPSMAAQLRLVAAALPQGRRLGVLAAAQSQPLVQALEQAAGSAWTLNVATAADVQAIGPALRDVLPASDALLLLPDAIGDDAAATAAVLRAAAGAGVPVFGASDAMVRSGALASALCGPAQMARQAQALGRRLVAGPDEALLVEAARPSTVSVNGNVARSLGLRLPSSDELTRRVAAATP